GGKVVLAGGTRGARLWEADLGQPLAALPYAGPVTLACFSPDGKRCLTAVGLPPGSRLGRARLGRARLGDPWTGKLLRSVDLPGSPAAVALAGRGRVLATVAARNFLVKLWDPATGRPAHEELRLALPERLAEHARGLALSSEGRTLTAVKFTLRG